MRMKRDRDSEEKDPLTGETFRFIKEKKRFKKIIWIIIVVIALFLAVSFYYYANPKVLENKALEKQLSYMKCSSLCPLEVKNGQQRFAELCVSKCYNSTLALADPAQKAALLNSEANKAILKDYNLCVENLKKNPAFNYQDCFLKMFGKYKHIKDFSNYIS